MADSTVSDKFSVGVPPVPPHVLAMLCMISSGTKAQKFYYEMSKLSTEYYDKIKLPSSEMKHKRIKSILDEYNLETAKFRKFMIEEVGGGDVKGETFLEKSLNLYEKHTKEN